MDICIRRGAVADAAALSLLARATFLQTYFPIIAGADLIAHCEHKLNTAAFEAWLEDQHARVWIAEAPKGAPVGYALTCAPDLPVETAADDLELRRIYVLGGLQGQGVAQRLMETAIADAQARNAPRLLLGVYNNNSRALAFYAKHGFVQCGTRQFRVGENLYDDFVLARPLR